MVIDLTQFSVGVIAEVGLDISGGTLCAGVGWTIQPVIFAITGAISFITCYKNLIERWCSGDNWTSDTAMWIDGCSNS